jgi:hypothetical protein
VSNSPGGPTGDGARWSRWRYAYTDDYERLTDPVAVASNRVGAITAEQRRWYTADRVRSRVQDAVWLGGGALVAAGSALGWLDRRLLLPCALLALIYGVSVIRRLRDDPLADDLNAGSVASASGGVEAHKHTPGRGGHVYNLAVRRVDTPYEGYRQFRIGRQVYDRLPHPTDAQRRQIGPHHGLYTPSVTCRAYYLPRSSRLLSVELTDPTHE